MDNIKDFVSSVLLNNNIEAKELFNDLVSTRAMEKLAERKQEIAQSLFQTEEKAIEENVESLDEKSQSKAQQGLFGAALAAKRGMEPASPKIAKLAASMTTKQIKDFAATKHAGLPERKKELEEGPLTTAALGGLGGAVAGPVGAAIGAGLGHLASKKP